MIYVLRLLRLVPANNGGKCPKCGSKNIGCDNLNWWCNDC